MTSWSPVPSVTGYTSTWNRIGNGERWHTTAARLPPAESPPMASRSGSTPSVEAFSYAHFVASMQSVSPAGNGSSGASRYPMLSTL